MTTKIKPFISFIIPIFNCEQYIHRCVHSILDGFNGLNHVMEILLINDGSSDDSLSICEKLSNEYPQIHVFSQKNQGASSARNIGLDNSLGRYIWFVDADDCVKSSNIKQILQILINISPQIIAFNYEIEQAHKLDSVKKFNKQEEQSSVTFLQTNTNLYLWNKIYSTNCIGNIRFLNGTKNLEDFLFNTMVLCNIDSILTIPTIGYIYNNTNSNSTSRNLKPKNLIKLSNDSLLIHNTINKIKDSYCENINKTGILNHLLNFSIGGHIYSLMRFYSYKRLIKVINIYSDNGLYPIGLTLNNKMNLFIRLVNRRYLLKILYWMINKR